MSDIWGYIIIAIIAAIPPTLMALVTYLQGRGNEKKLVELHISVNNRLTQLLAQTMATGLAEGEVKGRKDLEAEQNTKKETTNGC